MKTIIEMASEAGWRDLRDYDSEMHEAIFMGSVDSLKAFAALVRADEREACAKVCDELNFIDNGTPANTRATNRHCAAAIRARGNT